jgi:CBS domain-containing membrane protein
MTTTVSDLMTPDVLTLAAQDDLLHADSVMRLNRIRHIPVVRGAELVGLITHRDLLRAQIDMLAKLRATTETQYMPLTAESRMTKNVRTVTPDMSAADAARLLLGNKYGCLPVVEHGRLVGIVTEADFLGWALDEMEAAD